MAPPLTPEMLVIIETQFFAADRKAINELLLSYGDEPRHREVDRIRFGVLELSGGDLQKAQEWMALAKHDYRDLIVSAEYTVLPKGKPQ